MRNLRLSQERKLRDGVPGEEVDKWWLGAESFENGHFKARFEVSVCRAKFKGFSCVERYHLLRKEISENISLTKFLG